MKKEKLEINQHRYLFEFFIGLFNVILGFFVFKAHNSANYAKILVWLSKISCYLAFYDLYLKVVNFMSGQPAQ